MELTWTQRIAESEGSYLPSEHLAALKEYAETFAQRQALYQKISEQEAIWIGQLLQQQGYDPQQSLPRPALLLAEHLARSLRAVAISLLSDDLALLSQQTFGVMESFLCLKDILDQLWQRMQGSLSAEQIRWLTPYWQTLLAAYATSQSVDTDPSPPLASTEIASESTSSEPPLTLAEMFV
ncbi:MAG: hypothetical protein NW237_07465 [Cyanobacteriota bacterium]|nr:hypothetical protein [Cyanobacteriota bacterium]